VKENPRKVKGDCISSINENSCGDEEIIFEGMTKPLNTHKRPTERINTLNRMFLLIASE
jgi:hypothetical protein